jgi:hypothetical protein
MVQCTREYHELDLGIQRQMSLDQYCQLKFKHKPKPNHRSNYELERRMGKIEIPYFDCTAKMTARAWVQKLDTYLQLNPMRDGSHQVFHHALGWQSSWLVVPWIDHPRPQSDHGIYKLHSEAHWPFWSGGSRSRVLLVLSYIACANIGLRKHLQGNLKEHLTIKLMSGKLLDCLLP